ncbi:MAG: type II toxin-antitoxin system HigB family toxin [Rhizobiaceae bacterium]|nr:type II toxin-antitoxin system HigB family toxin [Rhizobiaceae bacterium]
MQVVSRKTLKLFWRRHPQAQEPLERWLRLVGSARWQTPADVKADFGSSVDFIGDSRAIFDVGGNKFRIVGRISYQFKSVMIKFVGTHKAYDKIDPETA